MVASTFIRKIKKCQRRCEEEEEEEDGGGEEGEEREEGGGGGGRGEGGGAMLRSATSILWLTLSSWRRRGGRLASGELVCRYTSTGLCMRCRGNCSSNQTGSPTLCARRHLCMLMGRKVDFSKAAAALANVSARLSGGSSTTDETFMLIVAKLPTKEDGEAVRRSCEAAASKPRV